MEKKKESREELRPYLKKAKKYAWLTIGYLVFDVIVLYLAKQGSQAMKAAWFEDFLYFIPSITFLIGSNYVSRPADKKFRFGYDRAYSVGFIISSITLLAIGSFILIESILKLVNEEVVTIGTIELFGETVWFGWLMIAAVGYSIFPAYYLGQKKLELSKKLNIQILHTDAKGQKADWLTSVATIVGIIGIGFGYWWADAAAAIIIGVDILTDGVRSIRASMAEAMDRTPLDAELNREDPLVEQVEKVVQDEDWVVDFLVRIRRLGNKATGEVLVVPKAEENLQDKTDQLTGKIHNISWQITEIIVSPVKELPLIFEKKV